MEDLSASTVRHKGSTAQTNKEWIIRSEQRGTRQPFTCQSFASASFLSSPQPPTKIQETEFSNNGENQHVKSSTRGAAVALAAHAEPMTCLYLHCTHCSRQQLLPSLRPSSYRRSKVPGSPSRRRPGGVAARCAPNGGGVPAGDTKSQLQGRLTDSHHY